MRPRRLKGARAILVERFAEDARFDRHAARAVWSKGLNGVRRTIRQENRRRKFKGLFRFQRAAAQAATSHRILALFRGEKEEILDLQMQPEAQAATPPRGLHSQRSPAGHWSESLKRCMILQLAGAGRPADLALAPRAASADRGISSFSPRNSARIRCDGSLCSGSLKSNSP